MDFISKENKSNSNTLGISGAYITNWPKAPKMEDAKPKSIVTRLARGSEADNILLNNCMNNKRYFDYALDLVVADLCGQEVGLWQYKAIKAEVIEVLEESFK
jgi:hypothetical protein